MGVLNHLPTLNKPSVFKGCSIWHEINLGSVTAGQQMTHSNEIIQVKFDTENIYKGMCKVQGNHKKEATSQHFQNHFHPSVWNMEWRVGVIKLQEDRGMPDKCMTFNRKEKSGGINSLTSFSSSFLSLARVPIDTIHVDQPLGAQSSWRSVDGGSGEANGS